MTIFNPKINRLRFHVDSEKTKFVLHRRGTDGKIVPAEPQWFISSYGLIGRFYYYSTYKNRMVTLIHPQIPFTLWHLSPCVKFSSPRNAWRAYFRESWEGIFDHQI